MNAASRRGRVLGGAEVLGTPAISAHRASYAVAFSGGIKKSSESAATPRTLRYSRSSWARTSAAKGGRLRDAFGVARRIADRCKNPDQELKQIPLPCLINSADPSTYRLGKSVRTTRATADRVHGCIKGSHFDQSRIREFRLWTEVAAGIFGLLVACQEADS